MLIYFVSLLNLKAGINAGQAAAAVLPGGPGSPALLALDLASALNGVGDVIGQQGRAGQGALVVAELARGRLAPVLIVDLENAIVVGAIRVGGSNNAGAIARLVLSNAGPLGQLGFGHTQTIHLLGQGATSEGLAKGRSNQSQSGNQNNGEFHFC